MSALIKHLSTRPWHVALLLGLLAQLVFVFHIDQPSRNFFDEVHYVPAAQALIDLGTPRNIEHPLLGKELIAAGMLAFGDNPFGWRLIPSLFGSATVVAGFALLWLLTGTMRTAVLGALLLILNQLIFVQARIAMLDVFLGAFLLWAMVLLLWAMRGPPERVRGRWIWGSVFLGLAVAVKWSAIPYVALAGLAFLWLKRKDASRWPGLGTVEGLGLMAGVSIPVYFVTFLPAFFYAENPLTLARLIPFQLEMYALQTQVLASHTYQSSWWSWPLMLRPMWYFYEWDNGAQRGVLMLGNPLIMYGGLIAVAACYLAWFRDRSLRALAMALLWTASLAIYIVIPKSLGFFYYYYLSGIFICFALVVAFQHFDRGRDRGWAEWFTAGSLLLFLYFYPILSGAALPGERSFERWMWLPGWP
jgi:dolichyl-phosphate-mannose-protein mannosyltransferase